MTDQEFHDVLKRYLKGKTTPAEERQVEEFYKRNIEKEVFENYSDEEEVKIQRLLKSQILSKIHEEEQNKTSGKWLKIAASFIITLGVGITLYLNQPASEIQYITKATSKGQKATVTLSDGSIVRLNSQSSITYPEQFAKESREIMLKGEAYFDVRRDEKRPFLVSSHKIKTTVLGTSFNINAFDSSAISVALVSGKVKVKAFDDNTTYNQSEVYLNPGESAVYDGNSGGINVRSFDQYRILAWKEGIIYVHDAGYEQVFDQLTHWYGVEFEFVNKPSEKWEVSGEFKDMSLELVLNTIGDTKGFEFEIRNDEVTIKFEN